MTWVPYERIHFVTSWRRKVVCIHEQYRAMAAGTGLPWRCGAATLEPDKRADVCVVAPSRWLDEGLVGIMPWLNSRDVYGPVEFTILCKACAEQGLPLMREVAYRSDRPSTNLLRKMRVLDL